MTVAVKNKKPILVSPDVLRRAGFKSGDQVELKVTKGAITILPKPAADDEYTSSERRLINSRLDRADEDSRAGRVQGPFSDHKKFLTSLHKEAKKLQSKKPKRSAG